MRKEPKEVAEERRAEAAEANAARRKEGLEKNEAKKRMKGKNKPTRRQKKKQLNIIEVSKSLHAACESIPDQTITSYNLQASSYRHGICTSICQLE